MKSRSSNSCWTRGSLDKLINARRASWAVTYTIWSSASSVLAWNRDIVSIVMLLLAVKRLLWKPLILLLGRSTTYWILFNQSLEVLANTSLLLEQQMTVFVSIRCIRNKMMECNGSNLMRIIYQSWKQHVNKIIYLQSRLMQERNKLDWMEQFSC